MQLPSKTKEIVIRNIPYTVTFPNNRQLMAIYARKAQLSRETYDTLVISMDGNTRYASMLVDAIATFEVIMPPQFAKDLNVTSLGEMDVIAGAELVKAWRDQFEGWFDEWTKAISLTLNPADEVKTDA